MRERLAAILQPVADTLSFIYIPVMWALLILHALIGIVALLSPDVAKGLVRTFHGNGRVRLLGLYLLLLGVLMFSQASLAANPVLPQAAAVLLFLAGGTLIAIPTLGMILVESMLDKGPSFFRFIALLNILIAGLFYFAVQLRPVATDDELAEEAQAQLLKELSDPREREEQPAPASETPSDEPIPSNPSEAE